MGDFLSQIPPGTDLCLLPAGMPPDGTLPNFENPESLQTVTIAVSIVTLALATVFVIARIWVNHRKLKLSDYCTVFALTLEAGFTGIIIAISKYNRHQWDVPLCWFTATYAQLLYSDIVVFGATLFFTKAAIFLLYREIFHVHDGIRRGVWAGLVISGLLYFTFLPIASYYQAPKPGDDWLMHLFTEDPTPVEHWGLVIGSGSVLLDIYIFVLPLPVVFGLRISRSKRLQLIAVFGTALLGVAASVTALAFRVRALQNPADSTWGQAPIALANMIENAIAIIVGSAPAFTHFLRLHVADSFVWKSLRSTFGTTGGRGSTGRSSGKEGQEISHPPTIGNQKRVRNAPPDGLELSDTQILKTDASTRYDRLDEDMASPDAFQQHSRRPPVSAGQLV